MRVESQQVGAVDVPDEQIISFPEGLPGFRQARRFCLLAVKEGSRFELLQSVDKADLAFVVMDPRLADPDYPVDDLAASAQRVGIEAGESLAVLSIVSVPPAPALPSLNMLAPVVVGETSRVGVQVVLHGSKYNVRHPL